MTDISALLVANRTDRSIGGRVRAFHKVVWLEPSLDGAGG